MGLKEFITLWLFSVIFGVAGLALFVNHTILGFALFMIGVLFAAENILRSLKTIWEPSPE